jgi:hypothetical protein
VHSLVNLELELLPLLVVLLLALVEEELQVVAHAHTVLDCLVAHVLVLELLADQGGLGGFQVVVDQVWQVVSKQSSLLKHEVLVSSGTTHVQMQVSACGHLRTSQHHDTFQVCDVLPRAAQGLAEAGSDI